MRLTLAALILLLAAPALALIDAQQIGQATEHDTIRADSNGVYQDIANNFAASDAPDADDDVDGNFAVGSLWCDTTADVAYVCLDATDGAAVWVAVVEDLQSAYEGGGVILMTAANGDLRIYTDSAEEALFVDETNGRVGFGTTGPGYPVDVVGDARASGALRSGVDGGADGSLILYAEQGGTDYQVSLTPHATMTESTDYVMPAADGTAGQVLTTDGSAGLSWTGGLKVSLSLVASSAGDANCTTGTYTTWGSAVLFPGTDDYPTLVSAEVDVRVLSVGAITYDLELYDATNAAQIGEVTGLTTSGIKTITLTVGSLDTGPAVLQIMCKRTDGAGTATNPAPHGTMLLNF